MTGISSNIGLITGIPIGDTINQLLEVEGKPRDALEARTKDLLGEQAAIDDLATRLLALEFTVRKLGTSTAFGERSAVSSAPDLLTATAKGNPPLGSFQFTPLQVAQSHQFLSSALAAADKPLGAGSITFSAGGYVDSNSSLEQLNGGLGVDRGKIRITDRTGAVAEIDLRFARTIDDVLAAINNNGKAAVRAVADGDRLRLVDTSGGTTANLKVQEVNLGTTAKSLGLHQIDVAASEAAGADIVRLHGDIELGALNSGNGLRFASGKADLTITLRDGTHFSVDFNEPVDGNKQPPPETLDQVLQKLNALAPEKFKVEIAADGDRLVATDLTLAIPGQTLPGATFSIESANGSHIAEDLGLSAAPDNGEVVGRRIHAGLKTTLLADLNGTKGLSGLGLVDITDRSGASATVDLSSAETFDDVVRAINAAGLGVQARVNDARNGLVVEDTTQSTAGNLVIADGADDAETATRLGIAVDAAASEHNSGDLKRRFLSENSSITALNNGEAITRGAITIFGSRGTGGAFTVNENVKTIGDLLDEINELDIDLEARINDAGDGIALVDKAFGSNVIRVSGNNKTLADLGLNVKAASQQIDGRSVQALSTTTDVKVEIDADDTLDDLIKKINAAGVNVTAAKINDGSSSKPFRLTLTSTVSGEAGAIQFDASGSGLRFQQVVAAQDARLLHGSLDSNSIGVIAVSSTNTFANVLTDVTVTVKGASDKAVSITTSINDANLTATVQAIVDTYNQTRGKIRELTSYDVANDKPGLLFGESSVLRADAEVASLFRGRFFTGDTIRTIEQIGLSIRPDGTLGFDSARLKSAFASNPDEVASFFNDANRGLAAKLSKTIDQLAGSPTALLASRSLSLERKITTNQERLEFLNARLDRSRERWLKIFYNTELAIGKLKASQSALDQLQVLPPLSAR